MSRTPFSRLLRRSGVPLFLALALPAPGQDEGYPPGTLVPSVDLGLQQTEVIVAAALKGTVPEGLTLNLPPGFSVRVFAAGLRYPRFMAFDGGGVLHVANVSRGQIVALPDRDEDGVADQHIVVAAGFELAHSLAFYRGEMYVADTHQIVVLRDGDGDLVYEERRVLVDDIPSRAWHTTRTIAIDEANQRIYLSVGSPCDLCRPLDPVAGAGPEKLPPNPEWGTILEFNLDGSGRRIFASGVRNVVGMAVHPVTHELWGNNNGHDLEGRTRPPEWIDIIRDGDFMGHPFVHSHQVWNDFGLEGYRFMLPITAQDSLLAQRQKRPVALVPAHYAPMGIQFYTGDQFPELYKNAAFVAFHAGKAKLSSHPGYLVAALFSEPDGTGARMGDFITGFQTGTTQDDVWGFPQGLAIGPEGSLYVSSDNRNQIVLKITHSPIHGSWRHSLPQAVSIDQVLDVDLTVLVERLAPGGLPPRVVADLSELGGPSAQLLEPVGEATYRLDTRLAMAGLPTGPHRLRVRIEQEVDGELKAFVLSHSVAVLPLDLPILDDALAAGWAMRGEAGAEVVDGPAAAGPVFHGARATAVRVEPKNFYTRWAMLLDPPQPLARHGFAGLRFALHPGDLRQPSAPALSLYIGDLSVDLLRPGQSFVPIDLERREWQVVEVPFEAFDIPNPYAGGLNYTVEEIAAIRLEGNLTGTFHLDDMRLVTGIPAAAPPPVITAVAEGTAEPLPARFDLAPCYPNPFNSATTIGFALPRPAAVELSIYNLSGQEVRRLASGWRPAGWHVATWDGTDDNGAAAASGVYVYRLRAADQVVSRKLLLLR